MAAAPHPDGWEIHVIRHGRLAAAGILPRGTHPAAWVDTLTAAAETVPGGFGPAPSATVEETETVRRWLDSGAVRMVRGAWHTPLASAARHLQPFEQASSSWQQLQQPG
ncbi:hypothetical protein [Aeromicrobium sp. UC242_57]|uniref:hypothetical protein n=1 Tax=Aeromicrobium sp. UC242_57 TaxID=3374624 RepID=UPI0037B9E6F9